MLPIIILVVWIGSLWGLSFLESDRTKLKAMAYSRSDTGAQQSEFRWYYGLLALFVVYAFFGAL